MLKRISLLYTKRTHRGTAGLEGQHTFEEGMMRDFPKEQPGDFWENLYEGMENEQKGRAEQKKRTERRAEQKEEQDKKEQTEGQNRKKSITEEIYQIAYS